MSKRRAGLLVAGGGTGGHVLAGVAIADAWRSGGAPEGVSREVLFVGAEGGIEEKLVPKAGYELERLKIGSLNRVSLSRRLLTVVQLPWSFIRSAIILLQHRPRAVVGVGGYASGPVVLIARLLCWLWSGKVAILEQNAVPGLTNRILARFSHEIFLAFPDPDGRFSRFRSVVTGNPVRNQLKHFSSAEREPFTVFIFGGSQGALGINSLVVQALPHLKDQQSKLRWIHQTGEKDFARVKQAYEQAGFSGRIEPFIYDMPACYQAASLVICRAGSSTLSELATVGRSSILIPFPQASDNHQEINARIFEKGGAAEVLLQQAASGEALAQMIRRYLGNPAPLDAMEKAVHSFARLESAQEIVRRLGTSR